MKYTIFTYDKHKKSPVFSKLTNKCNEHGLIKDDNNPEIVFFVGGDGTFLRAVQHYIDKLDQIKLVGINIGNLGFFYDFKEDDMDYIFEILENQSYKMKHLSLISANAKYEDEDVTYYAVNEVRFENPFHTLISDVLINDEHLETFRGNGLIVASPLGSSAYNKSLGGAVVSPKLNALEITEVASIQNNAFRSLGSSLVVPGDAKITFKGDFTNVVIGFDFESIKKDGLKEINITISDKKVNVIYNREHSYIAKIKSSFIN